jgi:hypothetical protein
MSAYRNSPPPRWRIIYRVPLLARVGRGAVLGGFGVLAMSALLAACLFAALANSENGALVGVAAVATMMLITGGAVIALHWMTSFTAITECTIDALYADPSDENRCWIESGHEHWLLPLRRAQLREGQAIRVRYRDSAPESDAMNGREILEIKVIDD